MLINDKVSRDNNIQSSSNSKKSCTDKLTKEEIARKTARAVAIMDEYAANYNKGLPEWMWI